MAGATMEEWKAWETSMNWHWIPSAWQSFTASSTAWLAPAMTDWLGQFLLATMT